MRSRRVVRRCWGASRRNVNGGFVRRFGEEGTGMGQKSEAGLESVVPVVTGRTQAIDGWV
jgi:hypothetical protein